MPTVPQPDTQRPESNLLLLLTCRHLFGRVIASAVWCLTLNVPYTTVFPERGEGRRADRVGVGRFLDVDRVVHRRQLAIAAHKERYALAGDQRGFC